MYACYVTGILPPGNEDLKGDEVESIIAFKNAMGLDDSDAAAMHIEVNIAFHNFMFSIAQFTFSMLLATGKKREDC